MKAIIERINFKKKDWPDIIRRISFMITLVLILTGVSSMNACGFFDTASWKEEVLLHDGSKIIVKRWQKHGGPRSFGAPIREALISEQTISFSHPKTKEKIIWKDGPTEDIHIANFDLVALHIKDNIPYLVTVTKQCIEYNKWGRPNPPYVVFKYEGKEWKHIPLSELPMEFKNVNLVVNTVGYNEELLNGSLSPIAAEKVKEFNRDLQSELDKTILRNPMAPQGKAHCPEMIYIGKARWIGLHNFRRHAKYEACLDECKLLDIDSKYCPCDRFFKKNLKGE